MISSNVKPHQTAVDYNPSFPNWQDCKGQLFRARCSESTASSTLQLAQDVKTIFDFFQETAWAIAPNRVDPFKQAYIENIMAHFETYADDPVYLGELREDFVLRMAKRLEKLKYGEAKENILDAVQGKLTTETQLELLNEIRGTDVKVCFVDKVYDVDFSNECGAKTISINPWGPKGGSNGLGNFFTLLADKIPGKEYTPSNHAMIASKVGKLFYRDFYTVIYDKSSGKRCVGLVPRELKIPTELALYCGRNNPPLPTMNGGTTQNYHSFFNTSFPVKV